MSMLFSFMLIVAVKNLADSHKGVVHLYEDHTLKDVPGKLRFFTEIWIQELPEKIVIRYF